MKLKKFLFPVLASLIALPGIARDFTYTYEGQTLIYTVVDEAAKTCMIKKGAGSAYIPGNNISGDLIIPSIAKDGETNYDVISIPNYAFRGCSTLTSIEIPSSVTSIGNEAFLKCSALVLVKMSSSINSIGTFAFSECSNLSAVEISSGLCSLSDGIFQKCSSLKSVHIPSSVTSIGSLAFQGCALTSVVIPKSVTTLGQNIFLDCKVLKSAIFPSGITEIPWGTFTNCNGLETVNIPSAVKIIGPYSFYGCSGLNVIDIPAAVDSIGKSAFVNCTALTSLVLPSGVASVGEKAFEGCNNIANITIGHGIKKIYNLAFNGCPAKSVKITALTPPEASDNTFSNYSGQLYVPDQTAINAYRNATACWNKFNNMVAMVKPTDIVKSDTQIAGKPGDTFQLSAKLIPEIVTVPQIIWSSTNPDIATVDNNGLVTLQSRKNNEATNVEIKALQTCKIIAESLYANGPVAEFVVNNNMSGIDDIIVNDNSGKSGSDIDFNAPAEVYNLQGYLVSESIENLPAGIYIVRQGRNVKKIVIRK